MGWSNTGIAVLEVVTVIIQTGTTGSGIFVYNGTPAAGTLIGSWTAMAGTDPYGNAYPAGISVGPNGDQIGLTPNFSQLSGGTAPFNTIALYESTNNPSQVVPAFLATAWNGHSSAPMASVLSGPQPTGDTVGALILQSDSNDLTVSSNFGLGFGFTDGGGHGVVQTTLVGTPDANVQALTWTTYTQVGGSQVTVYLNSSGTWTAPTGVTSISCECWGGGGGGQSGSGAGGGGGEYAAEATLAVTPGHTYAVTVGGGGAGGSSGPGSNGGNTSFPGDAVTVTAHGGPGSTSSTTSGGTGSSNTVHFNGGGSHANTTGLNNGGAGGGGGGGQLTAGSGGQSNSGTTGGAGGSGGGGSGGGAGGNGGNGTGANGTPAGSAVGPAGGGGTGGAGSSGGSAGSAGAPGLIRIIYTNPATTALSTSASGQTFTDGLGNVIPLGFMGNIVAIKPGSAPQVAETWTTPSLGTNWAQGPFSGSFMGVRYQQDARGFLDIVGTAHVTAGGPSATLFTLDANHRPVSNYRTGGVLNNGGTITTCLVEVDTSGAVVIIPTPGVGGDLYLQTSIPLTL